MRAASDRVCCEAGLDFETRPTWGPQRGCRVGVRSVGRVWSPRPGNGFLIRLNAEQEIRRPEDGLQRQANTLLELVALFLRQRHELQLGRHFGLGDRTAV